MDATEAICWDKTFRYTNDRFKLTRFQVFFLFDQMERKRLVFRRCDIKELPEGRARNLIRKLVARGYLTKERFTYTITEKAIQDKKYFDLEYKRRLLSGNVWM